MQIRSYLEKDREAIRSICKSTAVKKYAMDERSQEEMCYLFLDYFLDFEPEHTFVAVDEKDNVMGYICGSVNYRLFKGKMHDVYDKKIMEHSFFHFLFSRSVTFFAGRLSRKYGCSMHMNVSPSHQHQRIGPHLLERLKEDCQSNGTKGIFLVTRNRKTTGYSFYLHNGFKECKDFLFGSLALEYSLLQ
jgi:GNAT superfamily N-acetyltransferase